MAEPEDALKQALLAAGFKASGRSEFRKSPPLKEHEISVPGWLAEKLDAQQAEPDRQCQCLAHGLPHRSHVWNLVASCEEVGCPGC